VNLRTAARRTMTPSPRWWQRPEPDTSRQVSPPIVRRPVHVEPRHVTDATARAARRLLTFHGEQRCVCCDQIADLDAEVLCDECGECA